MIQQLLNLNKFNLIIYSVYFTYLFTRLILHLQSFRDIYFQVDHNLLNFPSNYAVYTWKGQVERKRGSMFTALEAWFRGWKMRKHDFRLCNNIAVMLTELGQYNEAEDFIMLAGQNLPEDLKDKAQAHLNMMLADIRAQRDKLNPRIIKSGKQPFYKGIA